MVRDLSCFCSPCIDQDRNGYENESHVSSWHLIRLRPYDTHSVSLQIEANDDSEEWKYGGVGEELGDLLQVGENFVVPAPDENDEGVEFYILQCQKPKFRVEIAFVCPWDSDLKRGDYAIAGTYYKKQGW
jgi:hypothetical protein